MEFFMQNFWVLVLAILENIAAKRARRTKKIEKPIFKINVSYHPFPGPES
jgi:hypothetical protein